MSEEYYTAVLDRFEETSDGEDVAVLLIEDDGDVIDEFLVATGDLPEVGRHQDAVFTVRFEGDVPVEFDYDSEETAERGERAADRFDRLSQRLSEENDSEEDE